MGAEEAPHNPDASATGYPTDEIQGSLWRLAGTRLSQEEAARLLGVCERTFRRYVDRYEEEGLDGLADKRSGAKSRRAARRSMRWCAPRALYRERYDGWNVKHFYSFYRREHTGARSYTWVKSTLQRAGLVAKVPARGQRRERAPVPGMMLHQDGSTHQWVPGQLSEHLLCTMVRGPRKRGNSSSGAGSGSFVVRHVLQNVERHGLRLLLGHEVAALRDHEAGDVPRDPPHRLLGLRGAPARAGLFSPHCEHRHGQPEAGVEQRRLSAASRGRLR